MRGSVSTTRERASFKHLWHLTRLGSYFRRYGWVLGAAVFGLLVTRLLDAVVPLLIKTAIDSLTEAELTPNVMWPALGIIGVVVARFGIFVVARRVMRRVSISVAYDLRRRIFNHVQHQGAAFFHRYGPGDVMSRAINDIGMVRMVVSFAWVNIIIFLFAIATGLFFMIMMSPSLTLWVVLPLPLVALAGLLMARGIFPYYRARQEAMSALTSFTQENLNGIRTIQAMAQEDREIARFNQVSTHYAHTVYRATRYNAVMNLVMPFLSTFSPVIIVFYGGALVLSGEITIGTFTAFFAYLTMVIAPVRMLGMSLSMFTAAAASTQRIFEILDYEPEIRDVPRSDMPAHISGQVEFRRFSFRHAGSTRDTIDDLNFTVSSGETIAILGRVGAGKSTVLKSIVRLVDTPRGSVYIDGHDVCDFPLRRLRDIVSLVPQEPFLFSTTLRENLTYDRPERDDALLWEAVEAAGLAATIREFATGLDTMVGERGVTLSGGQKQRATLARGLIRDAPILLLDDCFSSVDTETEERILSGLKRMRTGKTTLLISHRVSTARHADRILVIEDGRIAESGSHEQLLARGGYYADLEAVQSDKDQDRARKARLLHDLEVEEDAAVSSGGQG